jgi:hypothetical protein
VWTYVPTGNSTLGLGTNHVSLEPSVLLWQRLTERLVFEGQISDWTPIGGTDFSSNIIHYGGAVSYTALEGCGWSVVPVVELVGWTVLGGKETASLGNNVFEIISATGDTIVNVKAGVRFRTSEWGDLYAGYGRALTGDVWYKDFFRFEYRVSF